MDSFFPSEKEGLYFPFSSFFFSACSLARHLGTAYAAAAAAAANAIAAAILSHVAQLRRCYSIYGNMQLLSTYNAHSLVRNCHKATNYVMAIWHSLLGNEFKKERILELVLSLRIISCTPYIFFDVEKFWLE